MQHHVESQYIPRGPRSVCLTTPSPDGRTLRPQGEKTIELEIKILILKKKIHEMIGINKQCGCGSTGSTDKVSHGTTIQAKCSLKPTIQPVGTRQTQPLFQHTSSLTSFLWDTTNRLPTLQSYSLCGRLVSSCVWGGGGLTQPLMFYYTLNPRPNQWSALFPSLLIFFLFEDETLYLLILMLIFAIWGGTFILFVGNLKKALRLFSLWLFKVKGPKFVYWCSGIFIIIRTMNIGINTVNVYLLPLCFFLVFYFFCLFVCLFIVFKHLWSAK